MAERVTWVVATLTRGSVNTNEIADVNVWDYETAGLLGTVLEPPDSPGHGSGEDSNSSTTTTFLKTQRVGSPAITTDLGSSVCFAATALAFCTPFPLLAGASFHRTETRHAGLSPSSYGLQP